MEFDETASIKERTLLGIDEVLNHALDHVHGMERAIVSRAIQVLKPRLTQRVHIASDEQLQSELQYLHQLLGEILQVAREAKVTPTNGKPKSTRRTKTGHRLNPRRRGRA